MIWGFIVLVGLITLLRNNIIKKSDIGTAALIIAVYIIFMIVLYNTCLIAGLSMMGYQLF